MSEHTFKVGDRVRRIHSNHNGMHTGDEGTVSKKEPFSSEGIMIKEFPGLGYHASYNFELISPAGPIKGDIDTIVNCVNTYLDKFKLTKEERNKIVKHIELTK